MTSNNNNNLGTCCATMNVAPYEFRGRPCERSAKVIFNGKPYCGIHDPEKAKRRQAERNDEHRRKLDIATRRQKRRQIAVDLLAEVEQNNDLRYSAFIDRAAAL